MRRPRLVVDHLLSIAVIGRDEKDVARLRGCLGDGPDRRVRSRNGLNGCIVYTSMANLRRHARHVSYMRRQDIETGLAISGGAKLHITKSYFAVFRIPATLSATPWALISGCLSYVGTSTRTMSEYLHAHQISGYLRRRDQFSVLTGELLLHAAVEKECNMGVFLRFWGRWNISTQLSSCYSCHGHALGTFSPAMWHWLIPFIESHSARTFFIPCGGKATSKGNSAL